MASPTYNPDTPLILQNSDWDCWATSARMALESWGRHPSESWIESTLIADGIETTASGLLDGTGGAGADWLTRQYSNPAEGTPTIKAYNAARVGFDDVRSLAGTTALLLGGHRWGAEGHWTFVRRYNPALDVLELGNPAGTYDGISQTMDRQQFDRVSPCSMVVVNADVPAAAGLPTDPDHLFTFAELRPVIDRAAAEFGADEGVVAGIVEQESGFRNWRVHRDGTGHGLVGLDDNGLLPDFERWSGLSVGRGASAAIIPPELQIRYLARFVAAETRKFGDPYAAARAWYRGEGLMDDAAGQHYEALIRAHVAELYGSSPAPTPDPKDAIIADLQRQLAAKDEQISGLVTAIAVMGDDCGDAIQAQVDKLRAIREQFIGPRPAA